MAPSAESAFTVTVSTAVLAAETNATRFEGFCRAVVSLLEGGAAILSTSVSWDLGRDGVGVGRASGIYVCCSLRDDVDAKALSDIVRLSSTTHGVKRVYFCSSHALSEHRRTKIEQSMMDEVDNAIAVVCFGSIQLLEIAREQRREIIETFYGAEIANTLRAIKPDPSSDVETRGLRLALISSAAENSSAIRREVYESAILDILKDGSPRTITTLAKDISESLRLQRNIATEAINPHLELILQMGHLAFDGKVYSVTRAGIDALATKEAEATTRLLSGRQAIRDALATALGSAILDDHFNRIWSVFEEKMAQYFIARGDALVNEISELIQADESDQSVVEVPSSLSFLEDLADAVAATSSHADQRGELRQAVMDLFSDRTSVATNWLVRVCASFVAACALGVEHASGAAIEKLLAKTTLVLDTDVLLSLLGLGEPEHEAVETIVHRWTRMGGKVLVGDPVLEEAAYHAHIAQSDFDAVVHRLPGTPDDRLHLIENVYVRSFAEMLAQKIVRANQWRTYINHFKGSDARDFSPIFGHLATEYTIGRLPARSTQEAELERAVYEFLSAGAKDRFSGDALRNAKDKARRDAELYSALVHHAKVLRAQDPGSTCILVSSARRLAKAEAHFQHSGEAELIVSVAAVLFLVSTLPDVSLGLTAMKAFLFDERRRGFSSDLERTLIRMVRSSQEYSMPWAKRGILMRSVRDRLIEEAQAQGARRVSKGQLSEIEKESLVADQGQRTVEILRDALDAIAVDTRTAKENRDLKAKVKELEDRLANKQTTPTSRPKRSRD